MAGRTEQSFERRLAKQFVGELRAATTERLRLTGGLDWTRPSTIRGVVNQRCNYRCRYCVFWRLPKYKSELTIDQWKAALSSLQEFIGSFNIQFGGGEPFIKPGFVDLLEFCEKSGIGWGVITNGSALTDKVVARVVEAGPLNIDISVDSHIAKENDYTRGVHGALTRVEEGVRRLASQRRELGKRFVIRLKPVVTSVNFQSLVSMVAWTSEIGADTIDFSPLRPGPTEANEELPIQGGHLLDLEEVVEELLAMKRGGAPIETSAAKLASMPDHFRGRRTFAGLSPCRVGMRDYHIRSDGDVQVCWSYPPIGNVKRSTAREIWLGDTARQIREETISCTKFGTVECANSCLTHRTLGQQLQRGLLWLRSG